MRNDENTLEITCYFEVCRKFDKHSKENNPNSAISHQINWFCGHTIAKRTQRKYENLSKYNFRFPWNEINGRNRNKCCL